METLRKYRFGEFEVDTRARELSKNGTNLKLRGQPYLILEVLLGRAGEVVTREEIQEKLWPADTFVDFEHGLNTSVKKLRQVLCDSAEEPRYIETVPRLGYRFIAPVREMREPHFEAGLPVETAVSASWWRKTQYRIAAVVIVALLILAAHFARQRFARRANPSGERVMLVVLPFLNLSGDASQEYFNDGLTEEMITQLGRADSAAPGRDRPNLGNELQEHSERYEGNRP